MYFPMSKSSFFFVAAGMAARSVTMAGPSALAQPQARFWGTLPAASLIVFFAKSMLLRIVRQNSLDGDRLVGLVPAIVVGDAGDGGVADFRLARQLGFRQHRHAEDVRPPGFIEARLGPGGKGGAFHRDKRAALVDGGPGLFSRADRRCRSRPGRTGRRTGYARRCRR